MTDFFCHPKPREGSQLTINNLPLTINNSPHNLIDFCLFIATKNSAIL